MSEQGFTTRAIHTAHFHGATPGDAISFPIFQTSSFDFASTDAIDQLHDPDIKSFAYSRASNPTVDAFERTLAALEGATAACAFASGMAAIHAAMLAVVGAGHHLVVTRDVYGGSYHLLKDILPRLGISHTLVDMTDLAATAAAMRPETRMVWAETISNPTTTVLDIPALAELAHAHGALLGVDATFTTPYLSLPLAQGADLVAHSATKYISGHGDVIAGVVAGSTAMLAPVRDLMIGVGGSMAPLEAFLLLRGLKTLELRMDRHNTTAQRVAEMLDAHPIVETVFYPGIASHPQHALARRLYPRGFGGLLSFTVRGDETMARAVVDRLKLFLRAGSLGDAHSLVSLPVMMSHHHLTPEDRAASRVTPNLIRVPIGLENSDDIVADLQQALDGVA